MKKKFNGLVICLRANLFRSVTAKTIKNPLPVLKYCSRIVLNSSCPAVSKTKFGFEEIIKKQLK